MIDTTSHLTVRFARLPRRGLLLGLSASRVACIALAALVLIPAMFIASTFGAIVTAPLWGVLVALAFVRTGGRPAIEALPTSAHFGLRRATGQTKYRARPAKPRPAGSLALPGDAAAMRFLIDETSSTAVLHDPHAQTLTVAAVVSHPAYVLLAPEEQARRVHGWGRTLASLAHTGTGTRVQVLEISLPDAGRGITGWWDTHGVRSPDQWAVREYEALMKTAAPAASTHRTLIAISLDLHAARGHIRQAGRGLAGAVAFLRQEMTSFEASLRAADLRLVTWLGEADLAATLRQAYEPGFDKERFVPCRLESAGPMAIDEQWDHLRHDNAHSAVLWINEWPRIDAPPFFLHALVFQAGIRKTISITAEPVPADEAIREIRKAKVEYATEAAQTARIGALADLSDSVEAGDVLDRERALIAGHADIRFTGLIAVTAATREALEAAVAEVSRAAIQSGCETRRLYGQQARAFIAAAPPLARRVN
ncbi:hypothetical protein BA895_20030 [Humibacillus sp. DSM 29435]|uniref:SCO6880 family protein n=1 Tax=Humibacillus sp. DSM 29435 TaxID=1869167 RepID=UPI00087310AC|nr:SCO6880 family protein [Humibacillus sp. DSM 29435]OFE16179.1 hypothetical protein BA895_20030 [Humibacillus sp. DSM 29435]